MPRTKFPYLLWWYTLAHESLFDMSPAELEMFAEFVRLSEQVGRLTQFKPAKS